MNIVGQLVDVFNKTISDLQTILQVQAFSYLFFLSVLLLMLNTFAQTRQYVQRARALHMVAPTIFFGMLVINFTMAVIQIIQSGIH